MVRRAGCVVPRDVLVEAGWGGGAEVSDNTLYVFIRGLRAKIGNEPQLQLPSYSTVDAQTGLNFAQGRYRVMLWGKNITNRFYLTNVIRYADGISRLTGMPATYGLTVSFRY